MPYYKYSQGVVDINHDERGDDMREFIEYFDDTDDYELFVASEDDTTFMALDDEAIEFCLKCKVGDTFKNIKRIK